MNTGIFIISLDFELQYGMEDSVREDTEERLNNTRIIIPQMLKLFRNHSIHVTWATVGKLCAQDKMDMQRYYPEHKPSYDNKILSTYEYDDIIGIDEEKDFKHYALGLIYEIQKVPFQEIASHTFSHYYCNERGHKNQQFYDDLSSCKEIMLNNIGVVPQSIVFPKNEINYEYVKVLNQLGIKSYRGAPNGFIYGKNIWLKPIRFLNAYVGSSKDGVYDLQKNSNPLNIKASAFLRPYSQKLRVLEPLKIYRIKRQMKYAAQNNKVFHLWWHPHNFGKNSQKNMQQLEELLLYFEVLKKKYGMMSLNMAETEQLINIKIARYYK